MSTAAMTVNGPASPRWRAAEVALVGGVVMILALLVVPVPAFLLDLLLAASIASSVMLLLVALYTTDPLEFSVFPTALLLLTLFRLALNVASTRLILDDGDAGKVIEAFGEFVIGGNYAVGIILFVILIIINFVVITKGAGRIAEVAARFTLDAMPGRQMSIDADLSAGLIDDNEAKKRREEISRGADFYGAMDGAAKFVRGDAIAGLLIVAINIVGGIFIGVVQRGMPLARAVDHYTILTVGDGLVGQVPALIVSTAAGIMVTYSAGGNRLGSALVSQISRQPRALWLASGFLAILGIVPGMPIVPFMALAALAAVGARAATKDESKQSVALQVATDRKAQEVAQLAPVENTVGDLLQVDPVELEVGYGLIPLVDERQGGDLLERIRLLRKQAAMDLGILIPRIRIRDDIRLAPNEYVIRLRGSEIARTELMPRMLLALDTGGAFEQVDGIPTQDPSFGMNGVWIQPQQREQAEGGGYVVVEPSMVVSTHLMETLKGHAAELLGRQDVQEMVEVLKKSYPALVEEVVPAKVSPGVLHRVLQRLLKERVPIRDLVTILEALADVAEQTKDPEVLTEHVRRALGKAIAEQYADETGTVRGIAVSPRLEMALMGFFSPRASKTPQMLPTPEQLTDLLRRLDRLARGTGEGRPVPLISPPGLRVGIRRLIEPVLPNIPVISLAELPAQVNVQSVATWDLTDDS
jgi:flagellar biosynthesis protein FlhA